MLLNTGILLLPLRQAPPACGCLHWVVPGMSWCWLRLHFWCCRPPISDQGPLSSMFLPLLPLLPVLPLPVPSLLTEAAPVGGSALLLPHVDGGFAPQAQCHGSGRRALPLEETLLFTLEEPISSSTRAKMIVTVFPMQIVLAPINTDLGPWVLHSLVDCPPPQD